PGPVVAPGAAPSPPLDARSPRSPCTSVPCLDQFKRLNRLAEPVRPLRHRIELLAQHLDRGRVTAAARARRSLLPTCGGRRRRLRRRLLTRRGARRRCRWCGPRWDGRLLRELLRTPVRVPVGDLEIGERHL